MSRLYIWRTTGWPNAALADYVTFWGSGYHAPMQARPPQERLLDVQLCMQPAYGAGRRKEAVLWQKVLDHQRLLHLITDETPPERKAPGNIYARGPDLSRSVAVPAIAHQPLVPLVLRGHRSGVPGESFRWPLR